VVGTIPLGGKPEFAAVDGKGTVFANIEDTNEVVEIDVAKARVVRRVSIKPCHEPSGMGLDSDRGRVFSGCHNRIMTVVDVRSGKVLSTVPIGANVDGNGFDPQTGLAFSSNGDGSLTVVRETTPGSFEVAETVQTQRGARTMAIDPKTHNIYLAAAQFRQPPAGSKARPEIVKGSFEIVVVGR
jgi:DNA-binding beta-propeller fold protein YncE